MNFSPTLLVIGLFVLGFALRSFAHPAASRLGTLLFIAASFVAGWAWTGIWGIGLACAAAWLFIPWIEILGRTRRLRLPAEKKLEFRHAPSSERFPMLAALTGEVEDEGFTPLEDTGWDWGDHRHFLRLYGKSDERFLAAICLVEQDDFAFYYVSVSARAKDGTTWTTWNYPFPPSLKTPPTIKLHRAPSEFSILELVENHRATLAGAALETHDLEPLDPERVTACLEADLRAQVGYNVAAGVLRDTGDGTIRYSWRGFLFLWCQFLRDLVRFTP